MCEDCENLPPCCDNGNCDAPEGARYIRYEEATDYYWDNAYGGGNIHVMDSVTHWKPMLDKPER
jgi:hypothetical protein